jgi:hypothetical protein
MGRGQVQGECRGIGTHWPWGRVGSGRVESLGRVHPHNDL